MTRKLIIGVAWSAFIAALMVLPPLLWSTPNVWNSLSSAFGSALLTLTFAPELTGLVWPKQPR